MYKKTFPTDKDLEELEELKRQLSKQNILNKARQPLNTNDIEGWFWRQIQLFYKPNSEDQEVSIEAVFGELNMIDMSEKDKKISTSKLINNNLRVKYRKQLEEIERLLKQQEGE